MELHHPLVQGLVTRDAASVGWVVTKGRLVLSTGVKKVGWIEVTQVNDGS